MLDPRRIGVEEEPVHEIIRTDEIGVKAFNIELFFRSIKGIKF